MAALVLAVAALSPAGRRDTPRQAYGLDKVAHAVGHASFAAALFDAFAATGRPRRSGVAACLLSSGYGVALELAQRWVPGRRFERGDVVAGALGSAVGGGLAWLRSPRTAAPPE